MTDKPEIKVGQIWLTEKGHPVRILSVSGSGPYPVVGQMESHAVRQWDMAGLYAYESYLNLVSLAPSTVKREVALYRWAKTDEAGVERDDGRPFCAETTGPQHPAWRQVSEPLTIEFTLLPGESAE